MNLPKPYQDFDMDLDEEREHSLELLNALFNRMLRDEHLPRYYFHRMRDECQKAVNNYYRDMFGLWDRDELDKDFIGYIDKLVGDNRQKQHEAKEPYKIVMHSIKIVNEMQEPYDTIVSILFGGIELGFALKAIAEIMHSPIDSDLFFVRYSMYDRNDKYVVIPKQLLWDIPIGKRILIMDDSVGTGRTLRAVRKFFRALDNEADITATEISYKYLDDVAYGIKKGKVINLNELKFESGLAYRKRD